MKRKIGDDKTMLEQKYQSEFEKKEKEIEREYQNKLKKNVIQNQQDKRALDLKKKEMSSALLQLEKAKQVRTNIGLTSQYIRPYCTTCTHYW